MNILSTSGFAARLVLVLAIGVLSALPATAYASAEPVVATSSSATQFSSADLFPGAAVEPLSSTDMAATQGESLSWWIIRAIVQYILSLYSDTWLDNSSSSGSGGTPDLGTGTHL